MALLLWGCRKCALRGLDAELCRSGGAVQVVGVERGERGERRGLGTIPSLPGVRPTACRERRARYALEGRPLGAVTIHVAMTAQTCRPNNSSICCGWFVWWKWWRNLGPWRRPAQTSSESGPRGIRTHTISVNLNRKRHANRSGLGLGLGLGLALHFTS